MLYRQEIQRHQYEMTCAYAMHFAHVTCPTTSQFAGLADLHKLPRGVRSVRGPHLFTDRGLMTCRPDCGACCIAPSITSPTPEMLGGKPAGVRCAQLSESL